MHLLQLRLSQLEEAQVDESLTAQQQRLQLVVDVGGPLALLAVGGRGETQHVPGSGVRRVRLQRRPAVVRSVTSQIRKTGPVSRGQPLAGARQPLAGQPSDDQRLTADVTANGQRTCRTKTKHSASKGGTTRGVGKIRVTSKLKLSVCTHFSRRIDTFSFDFDVTIAIGFVALLLLLNRGSQYEQLHAFVTNRTIV